MNLGIVIIRFKNRIGSRICHHLLQLSLCQITQFLRVDDTQQGTQTQRVGKLLPLQDALQIRTAGAIHLVTIGVELQSLLEIIPAVCHIQAIDDKPVDICLRLKLRIIELFLTTARLLYGYIAEGISRILEYPASEGQRYRLIVRITHLNSFVIDGLGIGIPLVIIGPDAITGGITDIEPTHTAGRVSGNQTLHQLESPVVIPRPGIGAHAINERIHKTTGIGRVHAGRIHIGIVH